MKTPGTNIHLGWTTAPDAETARRLAEGAVREQLAACAQVSGPITSYYRWKGRLEHGEEWRIVYKFAEPQAEALRLWLRSQHPYETPQWLAVAADLVDGDYAAWVLE